MKIAIIAEYNDKLRPHVATNEAIAHSAKKLGLNVETEWLSAENIENVDELMHNFNGILIAPGSPHNETVMNIIKFARTNKIPTLGTCGGFQNIVVEYARNVLNIEDASHSGYNPESSDLVVTPLTCSLAGQTHEVQITDKNSLTYKLVQRDSIMEKYYCSFGLNSSYVNAFEESGFKPVGRDESEIRIMELENHPFYLITLFVPQDTSSFEEPHPIVSEFLRVASL
ncbi:hypothetical protein E0494_07510 [Marinilabiliaceae bacterium JC040]|nr:hypothetical protein [Marinilabiliaceae bacterium JC040]